MVVRELRPCQFKYQRYFSFDQVKYVQVTVSFLWFKFQNFVSPETSSGSYTSHHNTFSGHLRRWRVVDCWAIILIVFSSVKCFNLCREMFKREISFPLVNWTPSHFCDKYFRENILTLMMPKALKILLNINYHTFAGEGGRGDLLTVSSRTQ